jgi:hypothetical protein
VRYHFDSGEPLWTNLVVKRTYDDGNLQKQGSENDVERIFRLEVVRKVPDWFYIHKKRNGRREDMIREAVGIFEPYDIENVWRLVD